MKLQDRLQVLVKLGNLLLSDYGQSELEPIYRRAQAANGWFSPEQSKYTITQVANQFLNATALENWVSNYAIPETTRPLKTIGLVLAGNIPAVGFHDILCCFVAGHKAKIKYAEKDKILIPYLLEQLSIIAPETSAYFEAVDRLNNFDAVIATGSDNSARYFDHYFSKHPNIIRHNRNSVAILTGDETEEEIQRLSEDIFRYYGLGCRSVSKLYVPKGYDFMAFMKVMDQYVDSMEHNKYINNYDYNRSVYLLNNVPHLANEILTLVEHPSLLSRISTLHYEYYENEADLVKKIKADSDKLQCVVTKMNLSGIEGVNFGESQQPTLGSYADNVDTMEFLLSIG